jgi:hypothetical protein
LGKLARDAILHAWDQVIPTAPADTGG